MSDGPGAGNGMKDESAPHLITPSFEPETQWSEVEYSTARPSALRSGYCWRSAKFSGSDYFWRSAKF